MQPCTVVGMGISTSGGSRNHRSDINITPLIDVVLVLLIIFLVTMPVTMKGMAINVPRHLDDPINSDVEPAIVVKVDADLSISVDNQGVKTATTLLELPRAMRQLFDHALRKVVFVDFDDQVSWEFVLDTMDHVRAAAHDAQHDEITVALLVKESQAK
jgi:biopolymer transport protein TolR